MNGTYTQRRRTQMAGGGIMTQIGKPGGLVEPGIMNYGAFDFITDPIKKVGERVRKIIPNEIANVAAKAAPFVAPFNPLAAGIMRGVGRYDKRGDFGDALKQGLLTYGGGQAARYLGGAGMQAGIDPRGGMGGGMFTSPMGPGSPISQMFAGGTSKAVGPTNIHLGTEKAGVFKQITDFVKAPFKALDEMGRGKAMLTVGAIGTGLALVADKLIGPKDPGETMEEYNVRRKSTMSEYLRYYYKNVNPFASEQEVEQFVATNTREYSAQGGRIGYKYGSGIKSLDAGAPSITYEGDMKMASDPGMGEGPFMLEEFLQAVKEGFKGTYEDFIDQVDRSPADYMAQGGRVGRYAGGMGLPGIPRMAPDGLEYDMSQNGGFQPLGAQECKDDIKANLAKNEFVFTADAVRGAGDGDIETGAQRMYDTMKRLENRVFTEPMGMA